MSGLTYGKQLSSTNELSIVSTGGNSRVETYNAKTDSQYKMGKRKLRFSGHYTLGLGEPEDSEDNDDKLVESARNWDARIAYEQEVTLHQSLFSAVQYEGNTFSGFSQRENYDIGLMHTFVDTDKKEFYIQFAYRYTEEQRTEADEDGKSLFHFNKGNITTELKNILPHYTYGIWAQYLPNFTDSEDYQINVEPSLTMILNDLLSLKLAYRGNYDNEPNIEGNERLDWSYTTSLVATY